ncbi:UNVERIFIED_CONTAM: hypothetical protein HDU68_004723, partial [Siphonaria sp. JEL0065]
ANDLALLSFDVSSKFKNHLALPQHFAHLQDGDMVTTSVWIKCAEPSTEIQRGGIVLGCQSERLNDRWPYYHWQIIMVDSKGFVRGSFESQRHVAMVGKKVNDGKWHHVVVAANTTSQWLYVDGVLQASLTSDSLKECWVTATGAHSNIQIGNGVISGNTAGKPRANWDAEYPFYGEVCYFMMIPHCLGSLQVESLYRTQKRDMENRRVLAWALWVLEVLEARG